MAGFLFLTIRQRIERSGISDMVGDSKFVDEVVLMRCVRAVAGTLDFFSGWGPAFRRLDVPAAPEAESGGTVNAALPVVSFDWSWNGHYASLSSLEDVMEHAMTALPAPSLASTSWLEIMLVEFCLRNRDRLSCLWPSLAVHYIRAAVTVAAPDIRTDVRPSSPEQQQPLQSAVASNTPYSPAGFSYVDER